MSEGNPTCPFCASGDVESAGLWGGQLITCQLRCRNCNTYFEGIRDVFSSAENHARLELPGLQQRPS